jgi:hypothetical protein
MRIGEFSPQAPMVALFSLGTALVIGMCGVKMVNPGEDKSHAWPTPVPTPTIEQVLTEVPPALPTLTPVPAEIARALIPVEIYDQADLLRLPPSYIVAETEIDKLFQNAYPDSMPEKEKIALQRLIELAQADWNLDEGNRALNPLILWKVASGEGIENPEGLFQAFQEYSLETGVDGKIATALVSLCSGDERNLIDPSVCEDTSASANVVYLWSQEALSVLNSMR